MKLSWRIDVAYSLHYQRKAAFNFEFKSVSFPRLQVVHLSSQFQGVNLEQVFLFLAIASRVRHV